MIIEKAPPGWSGTVKHMKRHKEISNPFALAWWMKKQGDHSHIKPEESMDGVEFEVTIDEMLDEAHLSLVVKGDKHTAAKAASARGIPMAFKTETAHGETVGHVGTQHLDKVHKWFSEPGTAPFPPGSLLHFAHHEGIENDPDELIEMMLDEWRSDTMGMPRSHAEADAYLGNKTERRGPRGANARFVRGEGGDIHYRLHATNIATFHPDNSVTLNTGGYRTATTKAHMNDVLGNRAGVFQKKGNWYVQGSASSTPGVKGRGAEHEFVDGIKIHAAGHVL